VTKRRWIGLLLALGGIALLAEVFYRALFDALRTGPAVTTSMPGALLAAMVGMIALAGGAHLLFQRGDGAR